jgi:general secretion pathway protein F
VAIVTGLLVWAVRRVRQGDERWTRLPVLGPIVLGLGELPYLETLHSLYGAGIPLAKAHPVAIGAVTVAAVKQRLAIADRVLQAGDRLAAALQQAAALHPETRALLATGEASGQLEDALRRALGRRREVVRRALDSASLWAGRIAYLAAVALVVYLVASFYSQYFAAAFGHR